LNNLKLFDVIEVIGGGTPKRNVADYWNGDIDWLSVKDFNTDGRYVHSADEKITTLGLNKSSTKMLALGDLIISARGTVGCLAQLTKPMAFNQSCYGIRGKENLDNDFLFYFLKTKITELQKNSHGAVFDTITTNTFKILSINLPPLDEQKVTASVLGALDDKIENNRQMNETLEEMARAIFKSWFVDFDPVHAKAAGNAPAHMDADTAALFPSSFSDDGLPVGWNQSALGDILTIKRGGSPRPIHDFYAPQGLAWTKISDATASNSPFIFGTKQFIKPEGLKKTVLLTKGELILSNSATPGIPKFLDIEACIHDGWLYFPESELFSKNYLYLLFLTLRKVFIAQGNGSVFTNLKTDIIKNQVVYIPTKAVLNAFEDIVKPLFNCILHNSRNSNTLAELRDTLLPKLMSGEIRVKDAERAVEAAV
jgi:type I restriction enzyme, S subunit